MSLKLNKGKINFVTLLILIFVAIIIGVLVYKKYYNQQPSMPAATEQVEMTIIEETPAMEETPETEAVTE